MIIASRDSTTDDLVIRVTVDELLLKTLLIWEPRSLSVASVSFLRCNACTKRFMWEEIQLPRYCPFCARKVEFVASHKVDDRK